MKKWLLCALLFSSLWGEERKDEREGTFKDQHFHYVVEGNNQFAFNLLKLFNEKTGNFCFSPLSLTSGLAQIYIGAKQETAAEMQKVLNFTPGFAPLVGTLDEFFSQKSGPKPIAEVFVASQIWLQEGIHIIPAYQYALKRDFNSPFEWID
ncbi:MAG: hypothetical protein LW832_07610, partial [Parachlamydia sp.]|nr:hypothetical protein [Parachlamydia sp.]